MLEPACDEFFHEEVIKCKSSSCISWTACSVSVTDLPMTATNYTVQDTQWRYKYFDQTCSNLHYFKMADVVICGRGKRSDTSNPRNNTYQTEHLDLSEERLSESLCFDWRWNRRIREERLSQLDWRKSNDLIHLFIYSFILHSLLSPASRVCYVGQNNTSRH